MRSYDINKGYLSNADGANFRGLQPLKDPSGKAYPTDRGDAHVLCPDCNNHDTVQGNIVGHARGSLGCPKVHLGLTKAHHKFKKHAADYPKVQFFIPKPKGSGKGSPPMTASMLGQKRSASPS